MAKEDAMIVPVLYHKFKQNVNPSFNGSLLFLTKRLTFNKSAVIKKFAISIPRDCMSSITLLLVKSYLVSHYYLNIINCGLLTLYIETTNLLNSIARKIMKTRLLQLYNYLAFPR